MLHELNCPTCGAPGLETHQPDGSVLCKFCGNAYTQSGEIICPRCEAINRESDLFCKQCGEKIKRTCAACAAENWAGAEHCSACGRDLDVISNMANRTREGFAEHLEQQRKMAPTIKANQEAESQKRLATMWEKERERTDELQTQLERKRVENKAIMTVLYVSGAIFVLMILCGVVAISLLR